MSGSFGPSNSGSGGSTNLASPAPIGNVTPNFIAATDLNSNGRIVNIPGSTQTLTSSSSVPCTHNIIPIRANTNITLTTNPQILAGVNGQKVTLVNVGTFSITLVVGNGLLMASDIILTAGRQISFTYLSVYTSWVIDTFIPQSVELTGNSRTSTPVHNDNSTRIANTAYLNNHLYNHDNPGWRPLTLTGGWTNFGASYHNIAVKRVGRDLVFVKGVLIVAGYYDVYIAQLPIDCRPIDPISLLGASAVGVTQLTVQPDGWIISNTPLAPGQFQITTFNYCL